MRGITGNKPELVEQGAGLITARLEPCALVAGCVGAPDLRFKLCPELPELPGAEEVAPLSTVMPTGGSRLTRDLLFDISPACFSTWYIRSTSGLSGKVQSRFTFVNVTRQVYSLSGWYQGRASSSAMDVI